MRKCIVLIILLSFVITGSQAQDTRSCESDPILFDVFGHYCLNPVTFNIPEMRVPIGTQILFLDTQINQTDLGFIAGYSWYVNQERYIYWVVTRPADYSLTPPFGGEYKIVFPESVYGVQQ